MEMRKIVNYSTFKTNDEFVEWQKVADINDIHTVAPIINSIDGNYSDDKVAMAPEVGVFVTYSVKGEEV